MSEEIRAYFTILFPEAAIPLVSTKDTNVRFPFAGYGLNAGFGNEIEHFTVVLSCLAFK